jgi:hypothetical protein
LFKDGCRSHSSNYRPISLLTSVSEVFERIISSRLNQHFFDHNIIVSEQFGFRHQTSTTKASCVLFNEILEALNKQEIVGGTSCNFKTLDSVNLNILSSKLQFYGIGSKLHNLIASSV